MAVISEDSTEIVHDSDNNVDTGQTNLLQDAVDAVIASKTCNFMCKESRNICGRTFSNSYELVRIFLCSEYIALNKYIWFIAVTFLPNSKLCE